jgi:uncharacterized protein YkwD
MIEKKKTFLIKKILVTIVSIIVLISIVSCHYEISYKVSTESENLEGHQIKDSVNTNICPQRKTLTQHLPVPLGKKEIEPGDDISDDIAKDTDVEEKAYPQESALEVLEESEDNIEVSEEDKGEDTQPDNIQQQETPSSSEDQLQSDQQAEPSAVGDTEGIIFNMINHIRASNGLSPLDLNQSLISVARYRASDMIERDYFSHLTPDGKSIYDVMADFGISYQGAGENIQYCSPPGWKSIEGFINTWMSSTGHRENILNASYNQIGIGVVDGNNKRVAVLVFIK